MAIMGLFSQNSDINGTRRCKKEHLRDVKIGLAGKLMWGRRIRETPGTLEQIND